MASVEHRQVEGDEAGMRLDRWFKVHYPGLGFGPLQKLLRSGQVRVDGGRVKSDTRVQPGQTIRIPPIEADEKKGKPLSGKELSHSSDHELLSRMVIYEDKKVIVLNKPHGLPVQGGSGVYRNVDKMLEAWTSPKGEKPRLCHRLDRDTSGVLVIARTRGAAQALTGAFRERDTQKTYWALVKGVPRPAEGKVSTWLVKETTPDGDRVRVAKHGENGADHAVSYFKVHEQAAQRLAWLVMEPETGGPTSFASMPCISVIRSSATRNISRPSRVGISRAASRTSCTCMRVISTSRIPMAAGFGLPPRCPLIWCRLGTCWDSRNPVVATSTRSTEFTRNETRSFRLRRHARR
jgi:23S rRNA pseudouridine955/2504/2580 synthase